MKSQTDKISTLDEAATGAEGRDITLVGSVVNLLLIVLKLVAGFFGHSQALIADAIHSVSDLFTDAVVLLGLKVGSKEADESHHFGHGRQETLASSIVGVALIGVAVYIGYKAGMNIYYHDETHPTWMAVGAAVLSIGLKEALYRYTILVGKRIKSTAVVANAWHHRSDALSSVAVLIGVVGAQLRPDWHILDAYAAFIVSFFILKVGVDVMGASIREFTDAAPDHEVLEKMRSCIRSVHGVRGFHDLRVRTSRNRYQMELHVEVDGDLKVTQGHKIAKEVELCLIEAIEDVGQVIVHVDPSTEQTLDSQPAPSANAR